MSGASLTPPGSRDPLEAAFSTLLLTYQSAGSDDTLRVEATALGRAAWQRGVPLQVVTRELRDRFDELPLPRARSLHALQRERLVTLVVAAYSRGGGAGRPRS